MKTLNCPHHGEEALEYIRGRLDNAAAQQAEDHLETCPHCSAWFEGAFSGNAFDTVDRAVQNSLRHVALPRRNRRHSWLAAAAAVTLMVAGYGWWQHSGTIVPDTIDQQATIASFDFEGGMLAAEDTVMLVEDPQEVVADHQADKDDDMLSFANLEGNDLGSWEIHT
jgi:anti-sigma factor RsiW